MGKLYEYHRKRNFHRTPEPAGSETSDASHRNLAFVVQKHDARNLHFDFRLEHEGVLKSWAVPRGPSLNPSDKRLAVETEDHPIEYGAFEGIVPIGDYGGGSVLVWDRGDWHPIGDVEKMLKSGNLKFRLSGHRLRGEWALIRTRVKEKQQQWLLIKKLDDYSRTDVDVVKQFPGSILGKDTETSGEFISPKLPTLASEPPKGSDWVHELKLDGYRIQLHWWDSGFRMLTRNGFDWTSRYPAIADDLARLDLKRTIIDGELTALDQQGKSSFELLQEARYHPEIPLAVFAFDLLVSNDIDLRSNDLLSRKKTLKSLVSSTSGGSLSPRLQYLAHIDSGVDAFVRQCQALGLEGIVSKKIDRSYISGRANDWLKTKFRFRESLIVIGYESSRAMELSSLLLAYYDESSQLTFAGRVGTGWNEKSAGKIRERLSKLLSDQSPLKTTLAKPRSNGSRETQVHWVQPLLVADVEFANWTNSKQMRQASWIDFNPEVQPNNVTGATIFGSEFNENSKRSSRGKVGGNVAKLPGLSHPERLLFPDDNITKADVASYLYKVNQWLLPQIQGRPISFLRFSNGIQGQGFFQRHPGKGFPQQITKLPVAGEQEPLMVIDDISALLATAQANVIELHPWGCHGNDMNRPDRMVIDLDPDESLPWNLVIEAAFIIRSKLENQSLRCFAKTTGGKGLHVIVPTNKRWDWRDLFEFSKLFAFELAKEYPKLFVDNMSKSRRRNRIFVDYHRNRRGATAVAAYSLRARAGAPVSTPVAWDELASIHPSDFTLWTIPSRLANLTSDPFAPLATIP